MIEGTLCLYTRNTKIARLKPRTFWKIYSMVGKGRSARINGLLLQLGHLKINFRYPPDTVDKEEITEASTTAEDLTTKAAIEIGSVYKNFSFSVADVVSTWRISQSSAKKALRLAGFKAVKRRWTNDPNPTSRWVHKNLNPEGKNWDQIEYKLFTSREERNPTINYKSMYEKAQEIGQI